MPDEVWLFVVMEFTMSVVGSFLKNSSFPFSNSLRNCALAALCLSLPALQASADTQYQLTALYGSGLSAPGNNGLMTQKVSSDGKKIISFRWVQHGPIHSQAPVLIDEAGQRTDFPDMPGRKLWIRDVSSYGTILGSQPDNEGTKNRAHFMPAGANSLAQMITLPTPAEYHALLQQVAPGWDPEDYDLDAYEISPQGIAYGVLGRCPTKMLGIMWNLQTGETEMFTLPSNLYTLVFGGVLPDGTGVWSFQNAGQSYNFDHTGIVFKKFGEPMRQYTIPGVEAVVVDAVGADGKILWHSLKMDLVQGISTFVNRTFISAETANGIRTRGVPVPANKDWCVPEYIGGIENNKALLFCADLFGQTPITKHITTLGTRAIELVALPQAAEANGRYNPVALMKDGKILADHTVGNPNPVDQIAVFTPIQ